MKKHRLLFQLISLLIALSFVLSACAAPATQAPTTAPTKPPMVEPTKAPTAEPTKPPAATVPPAATQPPAATATATKAPTPTIDPKATVITFWHAMSGSRETSIKAQAERFNATHPGMAVKTEFTGTYAETVTKALAAYRSGNPPTIVQVYEVGTQTMLDSNAIIPVFKLNPGDVDWKEVVAPIQKYYTLNNQLYCMPFNSSTAMLYYNKDMLKAAGLDPEKPPKTWKEVYEYSKKVMDAKLAEGGFSMGWPAWIFEQMFSTHDQLFGNKDNGRSGLATEVYANSAFGVMALTEWQKMAKEKVLVYGGREYAANDPFLAGKFPFLFQSTSSLGGIEKSAKFKVGTANLPRFEGTYGTGNSVVGGGCLWVFNKATPEQQKVAWEFFKFTFSIPEASAWHKETGYFPVSVSAYEALKKEGWFDKQPNYATAFNQILTGKDTIAGNGVLLGNFVQIRDIIGAAIEDVVVNNIDPKKALDKATTDTNKVLKDYAQLQGK